MNYSCLFPVFSVYLTTGLLFAIQFCKFSSKILLFAAESHSAQPTIRPKMKYAGIFIAK